MHPPPLLGIAATHRNSMFDPLLLLLASFVRPQESAAYRGFSSGAMKAHAPNFFGLYDLSHVERKTAAHIRATFAANERSRSRWEALVLSVIGGVPHYEGKAQPPSAHRAPAPFFAGAEGVVFVPNNHRSLQEGDAAHSRAAQFGASERNFVVAHVAGDGGGHRRQVGLGRLSAAFEGRGLDPTDPLIAVLEAANPQPDDRVVVWLCSLHAIARLDKVIDRAAAGDARGVEHVQLTGFGALQRKQELELPWIGRLARQAHLPLALIQVPQRLASGRHKA